MAQTGSQTALQTKFLGPDGKVSWTWLQLLRQWMQQLSTGFDSNGNLISNLSQSVGITGRGGTVGTILSKISDAGVVQSSGMSAASTTAQGAVKLAAGSVGNTLGSAAMRPATDFDVAGAAATAQANAATYTDTKSAAAQSNAEAYAAAFASNASNITSGTLDPARLPGISVTITTAALTLAGTQGSMTFTNGLLTDQTQAT